MGDLALAGAAAVSIASALALVHPATRRWSANASGVAALLCFVAVVELLRALWRVDPALEYVARHASRETPLPYRLAGAWGGMEGSLLVWSTLCTVIVAGSAALLARSQTRPVHLRVGVLAVGGVVGGAFLSISRWRASPFEQLDVPTGRGDGLLAVLEHPAMIYHPPILYTGLLLTVVPFAMTVAASWGRRLDREWRNAVTPWLRASWLVLGVGVVTGSQWAYSELGWGGFWAWDPVENSSLLPWLAVTIALHALAAPSGRLTATAAGATLGAFGLVVTGAYVTRSGTTGSIHAFAESTEVGRPLLWLAVATAAAAVIAIARTGLGEPRLPARSRTSGLAAHSVISTAALVTIAVGTLWPLVEALWSDDGEVRSIVRPDFYDRVLAPIVAVALLAMAVEPLLSRRAKPWRSSTALGAGIGCAAASAVAVVSDSGWRTTTVTVFAGAALGATLGSLVARSGRRRIGVAMAHGGFALVIIGAVTASTGDDHRFFVSVGQRSVLDGWVVELAGLTPGEAGRYEFVRADLVVDVGDGPENFTPELRAYESQPVPTSEAAVRGSATGDVIVVLESIDDELTRAVLVVRTRPLMPWVWLGAAIMLGGGAVTFSGRQRASATEPSAVRDPAAGAAPR